MILTRISVAQPVFATMVMLAVSIIGWVSYQRLPVEAMPNVDIPVVAIEVRYRGASAEAVEADIVRPLENAVGSIAGIDKVQATARAGLAQVVLFFDLGIDSAAAAQTVRDRLAQVTTGFPAAAGEATVFRYDPGSDPMMSLALSAPLMTPADHTALAETLARQIRTIPGVGSARVVGGVDRRVTFRLDPDRMNAFGIAAPDVTSALSAANQDTPAGEREAGGRVQPVSVEGRVGALDGFLALPLSDRDGQTVILGDVATLDRGSAAPTSIALLNGQPATAIDVIKQQGANTVAVAASIRALIAKANADGLAGGARVEIVVDNAVEVEESFFAMRTMLIEGALLAVIIVFLFLNSWRSTVITALALPISLLGTMTVLWAFGFTLNILTMLALSLAIGILIDDAIVVRENITRHLQMGKSHVRAALDGTAEIGLAVLATTLAIVAVFLPVAFMDGIIGRFFLQFGITVSVAVLISLFVAFTLDPMLSALWYDPAADPSVAKGPLWRLIRRFDLGFEGLGRGYGRVVRWSLRHRKTTAGLALTSFLGSLALVPQVGVEFLPQVDDGRLIVAIEMPNGMSIDTTAQKMQQVDRILQQMPEVSSVYAVAGGGATRAVSEGTLVVRLVPSSDRDRTPADLVPDVSRALSVVAGATIRVSAAGGLGGIDAPIEITVVGDNPQELTQVSGVLVARLSAIPGLTNVRTSAAEVTPTMAVRLNQDAAQDLGVSPRVVGDTLASLLGGETVGNWTAPDGSSYNLVVQLPPEARSDFAALGALPIGTGSGALVQLDQVATLVSSTAPTAIERQDLSRAVTVTAALSGAGFGDVSAEVEAAQAGLELPHGVRLVLGGEAEDLADSSRSALIALGLAVAFIYMVLASQFASFLQPLAIMASLPLSLGGVVLGLLAGGSALNVFSGIGFIMLMGLVVKNAILLVDNANQRVREGAHLYDALVAAGETRFRPIIMTTLAMILGMLPLAISLHGGSGQNAPMAHAVIGGLISSTLLTLIVVPVLVALTDGLGRWIVQFVPKAPEDKPGGQ